MKKRQYPIKLPLKRDVLEFLRESNAIEGVYDTTSLEDAKKAWDFLIAKEHVDAKDVLKVHKILMRRLRPDIAGKLRDCDVWIGGQHKKFIDTEILTYQLNNALTAVWMSFGMLGSITSNENLAKDCHVMFENVHPFEDGNGRVGRILYNWHRLNLGLPLHIIHTGEEQSAYYLWFRQKLPIWTSELEPKPSKPIDKRLEAMVEEKLEGRTLVEIGTKHGVSRERVRQLLFLTGVKFPHAKIGPMVDRIKLICRFCKKIFRDVPSHKGRRTCSHKCTVAYSLRSRALRPERNRMLRMKWYLRHKDDPIFREITRLRNQGVKGLSINMLNSKKV